MISARLLFCRFDFTQDMQTIKELVLSGIEDGSIKALDIEGSRESELPRLEPPVEG